MPTARVGFNHTLFFIVNGKAFFRNNLPRTPSSYVRSANEEGEVNGKFKLIYPGGFADGIPGAMVLVLLR